ncbi:MAG: hypothetical protein K9K93_00905 [Acholeplasmataceae bacterium]|nr:hypothetical protein [Acholeplasmataceae bacterium]
MRRVTALFQLVCFVLMVPSCQRIGGIDVHTSTGDGAGFPGWAQISLQKKTYDLSEPISITISYGHDYSGEADDHGIISHDVFFFVMDGSSQAVIDKDNGMIIYEHSITGEDLLSEDYRCDPGKWIFSQVEFNNAFEVKVDFSAYDFDSGILVISFDETFNNQGNIDDEIVYTETTHSNRTLLYFVRDDKIIQFSRRSFA